MKDLKTLFGGMGFITIALCSCAGQANVNTTVSGLNPTAFDTIINQKQVKLFTLKNNNGMEVCITNFGGRVVSLTVPDKENKPTDVVLGYDNIAQYADTVNSPSDYGSSVGRYANRIGKGKLTVNGKTYQLPQNNFGHCLHGGPSGWMYQVYDAKQPNDSTLQLTIVSPDGDNGFPGKVTATTTYTVRSNNTLDIVFQATTDKETVVNMTNHSYFNLNGDPSKEGMDMVLYINADKYTPADSTYMTTGEIKPVEGTPMDFRKPHAIEETIKDTSFDQIKYASDKTVAASLYSPKTGILLEMFTNEPGVQVYTGNFQGTGVTCKKGIKYPKHVSVCLESQKYPDSPNKKNWPSPYLKPGEKYYSHVAYKFSIKK